MSETDINRIVDWLERLSQKEGYDEARQFRRDIIDAMGTGGASWEGLSDVILAAGTAAWISRPRAGGLTLPNIPASHLPECLSQIRMALGAHQTDINRPATLSVEQFGEGIQAIWSALRGPEEDQVEPDQDAPKLNASFSINR